MVVVYLSKILSQAAFIMNLVYEFIHSDFISGKVLVLPDVFIVSYEIAKCVKEITRGSKMGRYFND